MQRLSMKSLPALGSDVRRFRYDRSSIRPGIVHLGVGAFHRAHQAVYVEDCLERGESDWGIVAASLRSAETAEALNPQDGLYTLAVRSNTGESQRIIGAIQSVLVAPPDPVPLISRMAQESTRIVTLTVTEKGYCHDPASGDLKEEHPDIMHDLASPASPRTAVGILVAALGERHRAGLKPFTIVSCDNLPSNGRTLKRIIDRYAMLFDGELGRWITDSVLCPSGMVDRIVPATTDDDRTRGSAGIGLADQWPVMTEPFSQWVLEDSFTLGRPDLAASGVELVQDVMPFEHMKLRLLNGAHSSIAYLGYLMGCETVADAMAAPGFAHFIRSMMDEEISPTLRLPAGTDVEAYKDALIDRFRNASLRHRTWQIAMDGSQKLPQRLLNTIRERLAADAPIERLALGVAGWMRYVSGGDEKGQPIDVRDAMAERLSAAAASTGPDAQRLAAALFGMREIFGTDLPEDPRFTGPVTAHLNTLFKLGTKAAVEAANR